jgi:hypothetical protein
MGQIIGSNEGKIKAKVLENHGLEENRNKGRERNRLACQDQRA